MLAGEDKLAQVEVGGKLRKAREDLGLTMEDVAGHTCIARHFLEAIEAGELESLPGLVFARNFVRQYADHLKLDPEPLLNALPKLDESHIPLPVAPAKPRSRRWDSRGKSLVISTAWLVAIAAVGTTAWTYRDVNLPSLHAAKTPEPNAPPPQIHPGAPIQQSAPIPQSAPVQQSVQVVVKASQATWVSLAADGKAFFAGTLKANETREVSATEQVKLVAGNAGGLIVSLNGRELEPIGPQGQVRVVRLTASGPEFLARTQHPATDPF